MKSFIRIFSIGSIKSYLSSIPYVLEDRTTWAYIPAVSLCSKCNEISESDPNDVVHTIMKGMLYGPRLVQLLKPV